MRRVAASFVAMTAGWVVMNVGVSLLWVIAAGGNLTGAAGWILFWWFATALVVGVAWLVIYLPVYLLVKRESAFWEWRNCVPAGAAIGAGAMLLWLMLSPAQFPWQLLFFLVLPATVGAVAAAVGRWLVDWSLHYRADVAWRVTPHDHGNTEGGEEGEPWNL